MSDSLRPSKAAVERARGWGRRVLVTDFDGTLTRNEFFELVRTRFIPPEAPDRWPEYLAGRITVFEVLAHIFSWIRASEAELEAVIGRFELEPRLGELVERLAARGWTTVVASAGCRWYVERALRRAGVTLEVYANPGRLAPEGGLLMTRDEGCPFPHPRAGVDKAGIVRAASSCGAEVAYFGDGIPDYDASVAVAPARRFATGALARRLANEGLPYRAFERWSEAAEALLNDD